MILSRYHAKRDFTTTREPRGSKRSKGVKSSPARQEKFPFVVQKHAASRLHYDFRLGIDGVLKSWAVPKGVPLLKGERKLAMEVEDHPLEYGGFEGSIPPGNYGAGTVMLWDAGICEMKSPDASRALKQGKLVFELRGQKLSGEWTLVRLRPREDVDERAWLLIKTNGDADPVSARSDNRSILSGKTMKQLEANPEKTWRSNRAESSSGRLRPPTSRRRVARATTLHKRMPHARRPQRGPPPRPAS